MAGKIPSPYAAPNPGSLAPPMRMLDTSPDTSGLVRGVNALAGGIDSATSSVVQMAGQQKQQDNAVDIARAEAAKTKGLLALGDSFKHDPDYATFGQRAGEQSAALLQSAGGAIRDPEVRQRWLADAENQRISAVHAIVDHGDTLATGAKVASLSTSLDDTAKIASDLSQPEAVRQKAIADMNGSIYTGLQTGLLTPAEAATWHKTYVDGAAEHLSINYANLALLQDPHAVITGMGVPTSDAGPQLSQAIHAATGGALPHDIGRMVAAAIGDPNYPSEPKLAEAYLKDPAHAQKYTDGATQVLLQRYNGDMTAAVIAASPGGGDQLAAKWVKSGHNEDVLPDDVRTHYRQVMADFKPALAGPKLPIVAAPHIDLSNVDPGVLDKFGALQSAFGKQLPVLGGYHNDPLHPSGEAIDIDVSGLKPDELQRLVSNASAMGFGGIGLEGEHLHLDTGAKRMWGPDFSADSVPAWAKEVQAGHAEGSIIAVQPNFQPVDPRFKNMSFDQRLAFYDKAKHAIDQGDVLLRSALDVQMANAPAAIANTGTYTGSIPDANAFVKAYGGTDGIQKWQLFDAAMDVAHTTFGMRTMSQGDILTAVHNALPTSSGDNAAAETKRFDAIQQAATQTLQQRAADPAGYVRQHFPDVDKAWLGVSKDPQSLSDALTLTAQAQQKLGMDKLVLLPKDMATNAAAAFNNPALPTDARIGALTHLVMATQDPGQQQAIYQQLVDAKVPEFTDGAMRAMERGDDAAASSLFRAAITDTSKLPGGGVLPNGLKDADVNTKIQQQLLDRGMIGDVAYGLADGQPENFHRAQLDATLIERSVKLKLMDGSAGSLDDAVAKTAKELYGDVKVLTGNSGGSGVKALVPSNTDEVQFRAGLTALMPKIDDALLASMKPMMGAGRTDDSSAAVLKATGENYARQVLTDGYWANSNGGYVFINPKTGGAVPGPDGTPLVIKADDVLGAGMAANARKASVSGWSGAPDTGRSW